MSKSIIIRLITPSSIVFSFLLIILLSGSCKHDPAETLIADEKASELVYQNDTNWVLSGISDTISLVSVSGTEPFSFELSVNPNTTKITIGSNGDIYVSEELEINNYSITVAVSNSKGKTTFSNILTIVCTDNPFSPKNLNYVQDTFLIDPGQALVSDTPSIDGEQPITYTISTIPDNNGKIIIDNNGVIVVNSSLTSGTYEVEITATNNAGSAIFGGYVIIKATAPTTPTAPSQLSYGADTIITYEGDYTEISVNNIKGSNPKTYSISVLPSQAGITINSSTGKISIDNTVDSNIYILSVTVSNSVGSVDFDDVLVLKTLPDIVRFNDDILPVIQLKCTPCHVSGPQPKWTIYNNAKNNIDEILDRIQRVEGSPGFMPNGGTSIGATNINLLQQWKDDGLVE